MFKAFLFFILFSQIAGASTEVEKKRFYKCYSIFVRQAMPENHALWLQVKSGTLHGTDACMQLLEKAKLGSSGLLSNVQDVEAIKILKRFSEWSRSFVSGSIGSELNSSADVIDAHGAAHYITRSVLKEGAEFRDIVTLNYALIAKRSSTIDRKYSVIPQFRPYKYNIGATSTYEDFILKFWQGVFPATVSPPPENFFPRLIETGNLLGFVPDQEPIILDLGTGNANSVYNGSGKAVNQHFGGGAIGSQGYLLGNMPTLNSLGDGGLRVHRIFGKNVLEDFLCRNAPYLRSSDVTLEVHSESTIAFRSGLSCMGCHAAQDNVAAVARNLTHVATNSMSAGSKYGMRFIADNVPSKMPTEPLPTLAPDPSFYKRYPSGRLFYRNYQGVKVDVTLTDLASLGNAIADQDDFYVCGVKRFYQALVGIEVDLSDPENISYTALSTEHKKFQDKVVAWGIELKQSQNMLEIIRKIIDSPEFVSLGQEP
jgi:hypothetical protein